jgi:hypothetical protein
VPAYWLLGLCRKRQSSANAFNEQNGQFRRQASEYRASRIIKQWCPRKPATAAGARGDFSIF